MYNRNTMQPSLNFQFHEIGSDIMKQCYKNSILLKAQTKKTSDKWVCLSVCLMVFNATFNNISVISWRSVFIGG